MSHSRPSQERWGKFHRVLQPGLHFVIPIMERVRPFQWRYTETFMQPDGSSACTVHDERLYRIDLRETIMDFALLSVFTRDNVQIHLHPTLIYRLIEPIRCYYETTDLVHCVDRLVQTTLRALIGDMGLDDTLASRDEINRLLLFKIRDICRNWGMEIIKVEILEIQPTRTVTDAMLKQLSSERLRRAAIITSDGFREQTKTRSEGDMAARIATSKGEQDAMVLEAQAHASSKIIIYEAKAKALTMLREAAVELGLSVSAPQFLISLRYIEVLRTVALKASKRLIYFPVELDLTGSLRQLASSAEEDKEKGRRR